MRRSGFFFLTAIFHLSTSSSLQLPHPHVNISPPFYNFTPVFFIQYIHTENKLELLPFNMPPHTRRAEVYIHLCSYSLYSLCGEDLDSCKLFPARDTPSSFRDCFNRGELKTLKPNQQNQCSCGG